MKYILIAICILLTHTIRAQRSSFPTNTQTFNFHLRTDSESPDYNSYRETILTDSRRKPKPGSTPCNDGVYPVCYIPPDLSLVPGNPSTPPCCWTCNKGMTMKVIHHETCGYLDYIRCLDTGCNWSIGDTPCYLPLPILCFQKHNLPDPGYSEISGCCRWLGGDLRLTEPIQGCALTSKAVADKMCADRFGCNWEMADYHTVDYDGMVGHGNVNATPWVVSYFSWVKYGRFWVAHTHDNANCWNSPV